jgi:hypothetical protein
MGFDSEPKPVKLQWLMSTPEAQLKRKNYAGNESHSPH